MVPSLQGPLETPYIKDICNQVNDTLHTGYVVTDDHPNPRDPRIQIGPQSLQALPTLSYLDPQALNPQT